MKREIKFRVWDNVSKSFLENFKIYQYGNVSTEGVWMTRKEAVIMQFTGLLDKNGVEIYEGDIFPCLYAFDGCTEHVMVVEWNDDRAGFFPRWDYDKCHQKGVTKTMYDLGRLECIGNIYENPELLENTK